MHCRIKKIFFEKLNYFMPLSADEYSYAFIWIGKSYFDVINTIVFAIFIILILKLTDTPYKKSAFAMGWIFFILFFIAAKFLDDSISADIFTALCHCYSCGKSRSFKIKKFLNADTRIFRRLFQRNRRIGNNIFGGNFTDNNLFF